MNFLKCFEFSGKFLGCICLVGLGFCQDKQTAMQIVSSGESDMEKKTAQKYHRERKLPGQPLLGQNRGLKRNNYSNIYRESTRAVSRRATVLIST
jgi:hypothetical protein